MFYLGKYKSPESREKYKQLIAEYTANDCVLPPTKTKSEYSLETLVLEYLAYAEKYYTNSRGKANETFYHCKRAVDPVLKYYGKNLVSEFGSRSLLFIIEKWVDAGIARKTVNRWVAAIKQMFQWGVTYEYVEPQIYHALLAVPSLKLGHTDAPEYDEIPPVDDEVVKKTLPHLPPIIADKVSFEKWGGRGCLDRKGG